MALTKAVLQRLEDIPKSIKRMQGEQYRVDAQFNPQTLTVTYHTTGNNGSDLVTDQSKKTGAPKQQTGNTTDISFDLLFDTTETNIDVRLTTIKLAAMIRPSLLNGDPAPITPRVLFGWGTFIFCGQIQSMTETLDFFSEDGVPLRSTVKLTMTEVPLDRGDPGVLGNVVASGAVGFSASVGFSAGVGAGAGVGFSASASLNAGIDVGTTPLTLAQAGDSLQALTGRAGIDASWKAVAATNNIDNPRSIPPGTPLNLNVGASASAISGVGASASASANF